LSTDRLSQQSSHQASHHASQQQGKQQLLVLGATGSVGISTLDVVRQHPDRFQVYALTAHKNADLLFQQCLEFKPAVVVLVDAKAAQVFKDKVKTGQEKNNKNSSRDGDFLADLKVLSGAEALVEVVKVPDVNIVMAAIVGAAGLPATLAAAQAGKRILLANKEALVMSGNLLMAAVKTSGAQLLPIDSEHNAVFQCLGFSKTDSQPNLSIEQKAEIKRVILTASGGPFLNRSCDTFVDIQPEEACKHPKWDMGKKISVDSATLMNKGLEIVEACLLFDLKPEQVEVLVHPQSVVHSMVEYIDGSVIAQLANPDMKIPIAYGLSWPQRIHSGVNFLDLLKEQPLEFFEPDVKKFPCLRLAYKALAMGSSAVTVLNAVNEVAVAAFLEKQLAFTGISLLIEKVLDNFAMTQAETLEEILAQDQQARILAQQFLIEIRQGSLMKVNG